MAEEKDPNYGQLSTATTAQQAIESTPPKQVNGKPRSVDTQTVAGNAISGPKNTSGMNNKQAMIARLNSAASGLYTEDKHKYNKLTTFNSSHTGHNFERYYAHPSFKKLGFSPFRDNESFYNQNSSLWDDAVRGGITAGKLAWLGGTSTFKNWGSMFSTEGNTEDSDEMERLMSIGMSNRGGFGSKVVNFGVNMGYTYGVVGEILAEEAALALGTYFTGGALGGAAATRTAMNLGRLSKAFEGFKAMSTISKARDIWNSSKALQGAGKLASHLAPFGQTRDLLTTTGKAAAKWGELSDMAKVSKSFGAFYRDLREINAVTSEARLEGGGIQSGVTNELLAQFKKDKGRDPNDQEAEAIFRQAHQAGVTGSLMNSAGIYLSNKVVLDRALKGIPGMAAIGEGATRKIRGSFLLNKAWKAAGKDPYELVKGAKQLTKASFYKQTFNPKNLAKGGLGYLSANLMEGTQEVYQEAVAKGLTDYYISTYNDPSRAGSAEFRTKLLHGLKSQASEQGVETFLSGFLMAGPMSAMQSAFFGTVDMVKQKKLKADAAAFAENPDNAGKENPFQRELDIQAEFENKTLEALNETTKKAPAYFSALERDIKIQNDLARAADEAAAGGDVKAVKDARDASLVNHTLTLLQAGKFDIFEEQLKSLGELSGPELQEAFGEDPSGTGKTVAERLKNVMGRVKEIKSSFEEYQSMVNPHTMEKNPLGFLAFEQGREIMIHDDIRYKRTGQRMSDLYTEFSSNLPFSKANGADFANLFSIGDPDSPSMIGKAGMRSEIALLNQEIAVAEAGDDAAKLRAETLKKKRDSLSSLSNLVQIHKAQYIVNQSINQTDESFAENERALEDLDTQLKDAFVNHIKLLAEQNGQNVLTKDLDRAYQQFSDYWKLNADQGQVANALNALHDPYMFNQSVERLKSAMATAMTQREAKLKDALKEFLARRHKNKFFNDLFDQYNAFIDPDEADAYINENEVPTTFFDADTMEEIKPGSEKYKGIMALIDEYDEAYFEKEGKRMMRTGTGGFMSFREKEATDKRTIKQLGEEYGFDHTDVLSYVNVEKVLKAVMASKFANKDMKKLAQALLSIVDKNTQITFKTNHFTNSTYDATNGVIVDPRFSSEGFTNGFVPMEFSILNGIMQQLMDKSLQDPDFNDRITVLREKFTENLTDDQKKEFGLAMKDNSGFVAEVMTNPYVQAVLDAIPLEGEATAQTAEAKTLWQSFLDEVKALLEKLFGPKRSTSLYDEAVTVITNKLSQPGVKPADTVAEETFDEPTEDTELERLLREGFNAVLKPLSPEERAGMNYEAWKTTSPEAIAITNRYNADKIKRETASKPEGPTPLTESERKKQMTNLGYTVAEMNSLPEDEVNKIIAEKRKKRIYVDTLQGEMNFDEFVPMLDYIEDVIDDANLKLQSANFKLAKGDKVYMMHDALQRPIDGTEHERVSNVVKTKDDAINKESTDRGNIIDELLRDFLDRSIRNTEEFRTKYEEYRALNPDAGIFSEDMLDDLFDKFRSVELFIAQKGLKIRSNIPALYGTIGETKTAGKIDLLAYDPAGRVYIIDLKTSTQDRRLQYKLEERLEQEFGKDWPDVKVAIKASNNDLYKTEDKLSAEQKAKLKAISEDPEFSSNIKTYQGKDNFKVYFFKSEDARQQNAYMELLRQTTGIQAAGTFIFPLKLSKANGIYTAVNFQKENGNHTMSVKKYDIHEDMGLENQVTAYPENPLSKEKLDEFRETPEEEPKTNAAEIAAKKEELRKQIEALPDDLIYSTHVTADDTAEQIFNSQFKFNLGTSLSGTTGLTNKQGLLDLMNNLLDGNSPHRNLFGVFILAYPKSEFGESSAERKVNLETIENDMLENYPEFASGKIPTKFNFGYFKDGKLFTRDTATEATKTTEEQPTGNKPIPKLGNTYLEEITALQRGDSLNFTQTDVTKRITELLATGLKTDQEKEEFYNILKPLDGKYLRIGNKIGRVQTDSRMFVKTEGDKEAHITFENVQSMYREGSMPELISVQYSNYSKWSYSNVSSEYVGKPVEITSASQNEVLDAVHPAYNKKAIAQIKDRYKDETVAYLRRYEQNELRKAIPNIENYKDADGNIDESKMSDEELDKYYEIYNRYDADIAPLLGLPLNPKSRKVKTGSTKFPQKFNVTAALEEVLKDNPELAAIGTVQDYADYLTSVFPETVLKDIFYRGTPDPNMIEAEDLDPRKGTGAKNLGIGIYWTPDKRKASLYTDGKAGKGRVLAAILNVRNFYITSIESNWSRGFLTPDNLTVSELTNGADTLISFKGLDRDTQVSQETGTSLVYIGKYEGPRDEYGLPGVQDFSRSVPTIGELAVDSNQQVHILGSKKDLQGFKDFVSKKEPVVIESTIPDALKGKVIFVTPTKTSTTMLSGMPGITYGSDVYLDIVLNEFNDPFIADLRNAEGSVAEEKVKDAATDLLNVIDRYKSSSQNVSTADVKTINGAITRLTNETASKNLPATFITKLKKIQNSAWTKTMNQARSLADKGQTVIFDLNNAAASGKIDLALLTSNSDLGNLGYNYDRAIAGIKSKSFNITGKNLLDILNGTVDLEFSIPEALKNLKNNINQASRKEFDTIQILLNNLPRGIYDQLLQDQSITQEDLDKIIQAKKNKLATTFTIDDLVVDPSNPTVVQYTVNESTGGKSLKQGVVIGNDGMRVRIAEFVPGLTFEDLEESKNVVTFTEKEVPYVIVPLKPQTPTQVDPDVNAQSDDMMNDPVSDPATSMSNLQTDLESTKNVSAADALASFKKNQKCKK